MIVFSLLEKIEDLIDEAAKVPFSNKAMIDREEILEIISEIRIELPDEIKQASWMQKERDRILGEAEEEAEKVIKSAYMKQESLLDEHELVSIATRNAKEIEENARRNAFEINSATKEYCSKLIMKTEKGLEKMLEILKENKIEIDEM